MKIKTSELTGAALDWAVAKLGVDMTTVNFDPAKRDRGHGYQCDQCADLDESQIYALSLLGDSAFLEKDCDMSLFIQAMNATGHEFKLNEVHTNYDSPVRSFSRFYL